MMELRRQSENSSDQPDRIHEDISDELLSAERLSSVTQLAENLLDQLQSIIPNAGSAAKKQVDFYDEVRRFETELIQLALEHTQGSQTRAARLLNIKITTLNSKIKRYGIHIPERD